VTGQLNHSRFAALAGWLRRRRRLLPLVVLATAAVVVTAALAVGFGRDPQVVPSALIGQPAPPLAGETLDGGHLDLTEHRGSVVLVNVWASWCDACIEEHPVLIDTQQDLGSRGLQIIGINMSDTRQAARAFLDEMGGATYPSVFDPTAEIAVAWGVFGVPETYVVDRDGIVVAKAIGPVTTGWIQTSVVPLLADQGAS
jgi:cytochrome c biogenesis protein CcmG/thiol:disulfide interchange protein DsbE